MGLCSAEGDGGSAEEQPQAFAASFCRQLLTSQKINATLIDSVLQMGTRTVLSWGLTEGCERNSHFRFSLCLLVDMHR